MPDASMREELAGLQAELAEKLTASQQVEAARRQGAEAERQILGQTLHDTVSQSLTAAYFSAKAIEKKWQGGAPERSREIAELCETIHAAVRELHELTKRLRAGDGGG